MINLLWLIILAIGVVMYLWGLRKGRQDKLRDGVKHVHVWTRWSEGTFWEQRRCRICGANQGRTPTNLPPEGDNK